MPKNRRRPEKANNRHVSKAREPKRWIALLPALLVVVLNLPCIGLGYFWDDYYFLTGNGHHDAHANLFPDPHASFYRPIPLGIYFRILGTLDPNKGALGHILNLAALACTVALLVGLVSQLCGRRAGLFSGVIFASYGQMSGLVAWVSCSQDLFAMLFVTAAFLLRHRGKNVAALVCATAGLLCKEPAIAAFPVLIVWDQLIGRAPRRLRLQLAGYISVAVLWALIHPGIRSLAGSGFKSGSTGYVGIEHPERWGLYLWRYLMTLVNLPPSGLIPSWWENRAWYGLAALAILIGGLWYLYRPRTSGEFAGSLPLTRLGLVSALLALPSLLMPTILVRHWAPYFTCIPALGVAMFLGPGLARHGRLIGTAVLGVFLLLGIWSRGVRADREWILSELNMVDAARAVRTVRANFRALFPTFPKGSQVLVSIATRGIRGIRLALVDGQALSLWYRDPTLLTTTTTEHRPGNPAEFLVRVTDNLDVIEIDPDNLRVRSTRSGSPDLTEIDSPLVIYARAVAASGDTDRAIRIMEGLNRIESGDQVSYNRRLIASMLLVAGRQREADSIMAATPSFPKEVALQLVLELFEAASASEQLDAAAFEAFGLSGTDPENLRWIMRELQRGGSMAQAAWLALKVQRLIPGDPESAEVLERSAQAGIEPRREPALRLPAHRADGS